MIVIFKTRCFSFLSGRNSFYVLNFQILSGKKIRRLDDLTDIEAPQKLQIGGQQSIRATAYFPGQDMKMVELLAWISTEHSIAHFYAMMPADDMDMLQPAFDQMVMSAQVP